MNSEAGNFLPPQSAISFSEGRSIIVSYRRPFVVTVRKGEGGLLSFEQACFLPPQSDSAAIMVPRGTTYFSVKTFISLVAVPPSAQSSRTDFINAVLAVNMFGPFA